MKSFFKDFEMMMNSVIDLIYKMEY